MSNTLNGVLERLRAFGDGKLAELEARAEEHRSWLRAAVEEVAAQVAALVPASKRQRLDGSGAARATAAEADERQVRAAGAAPVSHSCAGGCRNTGYQTRPQSSKSFCPPMCRMPRRRAAGKAVAAPPPTRRHPRLLQAQKRQRSQHSPQKSQPSLRHAAGVASSSRRRMWRRRRKLRLLIRRLRVRCARCTPVLGCWCFCWLRK